MQGPVKTGPFAVQVTATGACVRSALVSYRFRLNSYQR